MLRTKLDREVSNYFFDNGDLTMDLQIAVESLVFTNGKPTSGEYYALPGDMHVWRTHNHVVLYSINGDILTVQVVKPL